MIKMEKFRLLNESKTEKKLARLTYSYDALPFYGYVDDFDEELFLCQQEDDYQLDGYHVRRISLLKKIEILNDLESEINEWNGVTAQVSNPGLDLTSWKTFFEAMKAYEGFMIVEDEVKGYFSVGYLRDIGEKGIILDDFDENGIFYPDDPRMIPYDSITHVAWDTRYCRNWYGFLKAREESEGML